MSETPVPAVEARLDPRFPASAVPSIVGVRLSPGGPAELVNISRSGVLVEGRTRFVPGTRVTIVFDGDFTPRSIDARVIRCQVSSLASGILHYASGLKFDQRLDALDTVAVAPPAYPPDAASSPCPPQARSQTAPTRNASRRSQPTAVRRRAVNRW